MLPDIHAQVRTRLVFNFAVDPAVLGERLPVDWLLPQLRDGAAVLSVCFLALRHVTFGALPRNAGLSSDNCAIRWGVIDARTDSPAVWVEDRLTGSRFASFVTGLGFPGFHPLANISINDEGFPFVVAVKAGATGPQFVATATSGEDAETRLFSGTTDFAEFIAHGVRSFAPATGGRHLNVVDLHKEEGKFHPLRVTEMSELAVSEGLVLPVASFDSAYLTQGSHYTWHYHGRIPLEEPLNSSLVEKRTL